MADKDKPAKPTDDPTGLFELAQEIAYPGRPVTGSQSPSQPSRKKYIGDGVYADWDNEDLILTTEDGIHATNRIVLEPKVYAALTAYVRATSPNL